MEFHRNDEPQPDTDADAHVVIQRCAACLDIKPQGRMTIVGDRWQCSPAGTGCLPPRAERW